MIRTVTIPPAPAPASQSESESSLYFRKFIGPQGLRAIRDDWRAIQRDLRPRRHFHLYEWHENYMQTLDEAPSSTLFFVAYRQARPVAVFALRPSTWHIGGLGLRTVETLWHKHSTLSDFVCGNDQAGQDVVAGFLDYLRVQRDLPWDVMIAKRALEDSALVQSLGRCDKFIITTRQAEPCDYLSIGDYQGLIELLSKNSARNLKKAHAKAAKMPDIRFCSADHPGDLGRAFEEFVDVEASGWKGAGGTGSAIKLNPCVREFYRGIMQDFSSRWKCEIDLLKAGDTCLAGSFCLLLDDTCYFLKTAHNEDYRHLSPGHLLLDYMSRVHGRAGGCKYINLISDAKWHSFWNPSAHRTFDTYIFQRSPRGVAAAALLKAHRICGQAKRNIRSWIVREQAGA